MVVYIEGDGRAYVNRRTPSNDPTPGNPMALRLALADPSLRVLYLGRPCQYTRGGEPLLHAVLDPGALWRGTWCAQ